MKSIIISLLSLFIASSLCYSHDTLSHSTKFKRVVNLSFGMGISMSTTPSFNDYLINSVPNLNRDSVKNFSVGFEFFGGLEMELSRRFSVKLDYSYFFKSKTYYSIYTYNINYNIHQPVLMGYYIISGAGYKFKLGGGVGYSFAFMTHNIEGGGAVDYHSGGPSIKGEVLFDMRLSGRLSSYISGFVSRNSLSKLKDANGNFLKDPITGNNVNLNGLAFGLRLGLNVKIN